MLTKHYKSAPVFVVAVSQKTYSIFHSFIWKLCVTIEIYLLY